MSIANRLTGGDPRSLYGVEGVVDAVIAEPALIDELFESVFSDDPIVRMRASDALEKVASQEPSIVQPFAEQVLSDMATFDQNSVRWHAAEILAALELDDSQTSRAVEIMFGYLDTIDDWIVVNLTMAALAELVRRNRKLRPRFLDTLYGFENHRLRSVKKQAAKFIAEFEK